MLAAGLHAGSCLGVALALRSDIAGLDRRTTGLLAVASVPAAVAGALAGDVVEARLGQPRQLAALLAGAGLLVALADARPGTRAVSTRDAGVAGLAQVVALVPGVSRSGAVLTALRARGVRRRDATAFAALLSLPVTAGAAGWTLARADAAARAGVRRDLAVGLPVAAGSAFSALSLLRRRGGPSLRGAALYRLALAAAVVVRLKKEPA